MDYAPSEGLPARSQGWQDSISRFGLTEVYNSVDARVDIVLLHGLNGHPWRTWTSKENGAFWPSQLLQPFIKEERARVLVYGYDADIALPNALSSLRDDEKNLSDPTSENLSSKGQSVDDSPFSPSTKDKVHNHAETLVATLCANRRRNAAERPIIFVAHSFGGLVVKRALIYSSEIRSQHTHRLRSIFVSTYGIIFLGTPHGGFNILSRSDEPQRYDIDALKPKSEMLQNIDRHFSQLVDNFCIYFFHEGKPTSINRDWHYIVEEESAAPSIPDVERAAIQQDHAHMCKFANESSPGFALLVEAVQRYAVQAPSVVQHRWKTERDKQEIRVEAQIRELRGDTPKEARSMPASRSFNTNLISQPKHYYMVPREPVKNFIGRKLQLRQISSTFTLQSRDQPQILILYALGGQGKTQIVLQYCKSSRKHYRGIFWVNASSETLAKQSYNNIAAALKLSSSNEVGHEYQTINNIKEYLENWEENWLLVFDNYDDPNKFTKIQHFLPKFGQGHIIFTSRRNDLGRLGTLIEIPAMGTDDGVDLLLSGNSDEEKKLHFPIAKRIVERLGSLPLAIDQAAAYIRYQRLPLHRLGEFITTYELKRKKILSYTPNNFWEYGMMQIHNEEEQNKAINAFTTWEMSLEQLRDGNIWREEMTHVLTLSAFFNPAKVEAWLFGYYLEAVGEKVKWLCVFSANEDSEEENEEETNSGSNDEWNGEIDQELKDEDDEILDEHQRSKLEGTDQVNSTSDEDDDIGVSTVATDNKMKLWRRRSRYRWDGDQFWDTISKYHALSLVQSIGKDTDAAFFSLHPLIRDWLQLRETKISRQRFVRESLEIVAVNAEAVMAAAASDGCDYSVDIDISLLAHTGICRKNDERFVSTRYQLGNDLENCHVASSLARYYRYFDDRKISEQLLIRIQNTQMRMLGLENDSTLADIDNIPALREDQGKHTEADHLSCHETSAWQREPMRNEDLELLTTMCNLAYTLYAQEKYDETYRIHSKALKLNEKMLEKTYMHTLHGVNDRTLKMKYQGILDEAEKTHFQILQLRQKMFDREHSDLLYSRNSFAVPYDNDAIKIYRQALLYTFVALGKRHPTTLMVMNDLAVSLDSEDEFEEAEEIHHQTLRLRAEVLGTKHPDTLKSMDRLTELRSRQANQEAENMHRQALHFDEKVLGNTHVDTLTSMHNLALILHDQGKSEEASKWFYETLYLRQQVLGEKHPSTLGSMHNLALVLPQPEAEEMLRETIRLSEEVLGERHPYTLLSLHNLALERPDDEAEDMLRQLVQKEEEVLGKQHPQTLLSLEDLAHCVWRQDRHAEVEVIDREVLRRKDHYDVTSNIRWAKSRSWYH